MAVGTIAGINVSGVRKDGITLSFTKPANTTKFKIDMDPTGTGATLSYTIFNSSATGSKVTFDFPSLKPDTKYYLYVTPYNGTTAGTRKQYTNSSTSNIITTPKAVVTPTPTTIKPPASSSGNTTPTVVKPTSPVGQTLNDATVSSSSGANSQTPTPQISGSVTSAKPSDLNNPARQSLQVTGLNPNQTYTITVYAITTTSDGQVVHSENSSALVINTPSVAASGNSFTNSNTGSDTKLSGGSIFAGDFPINTGLFDPEGGTTSGTGVILNQYGLAGYATGTREFYIDSRTGNAIFAGRVAAGNVKIGPGVGPGGENGIWISPTNYWYDTGSWSANGSDIKGALVGTDLPKPDAVTNVSATWSGFDFKVAFTDDTASANNSSLSYFEIKLVGNSGTKTFSVAPTSGSAQSFGLSLAQNRAAFGVPQTSFSATSSITPVDTYGNRGTTVTFTSSPYVSPLSIPTITATGIAGGYTVNYGTQTSTSFGIVVVEEIESATTPGPSATWTTISQTATNPAVTVYTTNYNKRYVRVKLYDVIGGYTGYSNVVDVTPASPVGVDNVGPANVSTTGLTATPGIDTSGYMGFNGYINLGWNAVSDSTLRGYRIRFTSDTGASPVYSYVDSSGTGTSYKLGGLAVGATYKIAIATYDEYNNTSSSYVTYSDQTIVGTPAISNYITAGPFQFGVGVGSVATNKGLYFDASNYWYVNASNSALFKLGGTTSNYISWDGTSFIVDGNIRAKGGYFGGNVQMQSGVSGGASIYSGTLYTAADQVANPANVAGSLNGSGYILNSAGLLITGSNGTTTISNAGAYTLTTNNANIGGWLIDSTTISKTSGAGTGLIKFDSANTLITLQNGSGNYVTTLSVPFAADDGRSYIMWAGALNNTATEVSKANFKIGVDGTLIATSASIGGDITGTSVTTPYLAIPGYGTWNYQGIKNVNSIQSNSLTTYSGQLGKFQFGTTGLYFGAGSTLVDTSTPGADGGYETFEGSSTFRVIDGYRTYGISGGVGTGTTIPAIVQPEAGAGSQYGYFYNYGTQYDTVELYLTSSKYSLSSSSNTGIEYKFYGARVGASGSNQAFRVETAFYDSNQSYISTSTQAFSAPGSSMTAYSANSPISIPSNAKYVEFRIYFSMTQTTSGSLKTSMLAVDRFWWRADSQLPATWGDLPTGTTSSSGSAGYTFKLGDASTPIQITDTNSNNVFQLGSSGAIQTIYTTSTADNAFVRRIYAGTIAASTFPTVTGQDGDLYFTTG